jgi:hypothetical protein
VAAYIGTMTYLVGRNKLHITVRRSCTWSYHVPPVSDDSVLPVSACSYISVGLRVYNMSSISRASHHQHRKQSGHGMAIWLVYRASGNISLEKHLVKWLEFALGTRPGSGSREAVYLDGCSVAYGLCSPLPICYRTIY